MGWHPYFVKRPGSHVQFRRPAAAGRWAPTSFPPIAPPARAGRRTARTLDVDHCFDGWHGDVLLRDALIAVRISPA
jgi:aldose 1-epimerase